MIPLPQKAVANAPMVLYLFISCSGLPCLKVLFEDILP